MPEIEELALFRRTPLPLAGVRSLCPPRAIARVTALAEPWRLASLLRTLSGWRRERTFVLSFFLMPHALHAEIARRAFGVRTVPVALSQEDVELALANPSVCAGRIRAGVWSPRASTPLASSSRPTSTTCPAMSRPPPARPIWT
jgi:hypothetical protein